MHEHFLIISLPLLAIIWSTMHLSVEAQRDLDPCRLFANGTKLRHPDDCSQEIICIDFKSVNGIKCSGSMPFYNKDDSKCDKNLKDHSKCNIDCKNKTGTFVKDPKSCFGYYYCQEDNVALYGHCPLNMHFNETKQYCIHKYKSNCSISKINICAIAKSGIKFKDESNCGNYYSCNKNNVLVNAVCPDGKKFFNAEIGECVKGPIVGCHPLPKNVCGTNDKPKKNSFVEDGVTCRGYFFCADVGKKADPNPLWLQCPENTFFSKDKQACVNPLEVRCDKDRCEGRQLTFVVSGRKGCRHYLLCENGVQVQEGSCGNNFFDENRGACTTKIMTYPACNFK